MPRFAHTLPDIGPERWEPISKHLRDVACLASEFAGRLVESCEGAHPWGAALGHWHDLGKYSDAFQAMLRVPQGEEAHLEGQSGRVDHSTAGAQHAAETVDRVGRLLAYPLAGHHAGLANASDLDRRLSKAVEPWRQFAEPEFLEAAPLGLPPVTIDRADPKNAERFAFQAAFFTRMLFSCLVDADRLATEQFCDPTKSADRQAPVPLTSLLPHLESYLDRLASDAPLTAVNARRAEVLAACRQAGELEPGLFSLTVPPRAVIAPSRGRGL